jgi:predicted nucleic acid-binding protein
LDGFDADALIYAAARTLPLGRRVAALFTASSTDRFAGVGSVLLFPDLLAKPLRRGDDIEAAELAALLDRLELIPVDHELAKHATTLAAKYRLHAADATHLATAVVVGADRFITNNQKDFPKSISEVDVVYPADLPEVS